MICPCLTLFQAFSKKRCHETSRLFAGVPTTVLLSLNHILCRSGHGPCLCRVPSGMTCFVRASPQLPSALHLSECSKTDSEDLQSCSDICSNLNHCAFITAQRLHNFSFLTHHCAELPPCNNQHSSRRMLLVKISFCIFSHQRPLPSRPSSCLSASPLKDNP